MVVASLNFLMLAFSATAQVDTEDPFRDNYMLGENGEILVLRGGGGSTILSIIDAKGEIASEGLSVVNQQVIEAPWGMHGTSSEADIVVGDFNSDGVTDFMGIWPGLDSTIVLFTPELNPGTLNWTNANFRTVQEDGFPKLMQNPPYLELDGWIRAVPGQFDDDPAPEIVVAYWADTGNADGGAIQLILYDTNNSFVPQPVTAPDSLRKISAFIENAGENLLYGSRFDLTTADLDQNGIDEIILLSVEFSDSTSQFNNDFGWKLVGTMYELNNNQLMPKVAGTLLQGARGPIERPGASDDFVERLAMTTGDFNGDDIAEVIFSMELGTTNADRSETFLYTLEVDKNLSALSVKDEYSIEIANSGTKARKPMSIFAADMNLDRRDEVFLNSSGSMKIYELHENRSFPNKIDQFALTQITNKQYHRTIALTDVDILSSDTLQMELITMTDNGIGAWQVFRDGNEQELRRVTSALVGGFVMAVGDFDGDAVQLRPPSRQAVTNIIQPLVILNAPPIHFDVLDEEVFDVNKCFNGHTCKHRAIYENASNRDMEVTTKVNADWGVSESLELTTELKTKIISASVTGTLMREYGEKFEEVTGSSENITVSVSSDAIEEDRIYATVSSYDILEYPVYADNIRQGSVVAVIPKLHGVESLNNQWFGAKSGPGRDYIPDHEVGNLFSYPRSATLPEGAVFFDQGGFEGGAADTWALSPTATQNWDLTFSSEDIVEREQSSFQNVSRSLQTTIEGRFGFFRVNLKATIEDSYSDQQISTHETTIQKESALKVAFGTIEGAILGSNTYAVSPYVYWNSQGALVLDYAVSLDTDANTQTWWEEYYSLPDLSMILPWRNDQAKGFRSSLLQSQETRDIILDPLLPVPGEEVDIFARIHNFSLEDYFGSVSVRFYYGDPGSGGILIQDSRGNSEFAIRGINARESKVVTLEGWNIPSTADKDSKVYVVIDEENVISEVHENNNLGWTLINPSLFDRIGVDTELAGQPNQFALEQNYPNPFNPATRIRYQLPKPSQITLNVYDSMGRTVAELVDDFQAAGVYEYNFEASNLASGIYIYQLTGEFGTLNRKMIVIK